MRRGATTAALLLAALIAIALPERAAAQSGGVLVVGDSLEVGTGPHLRRELDSVALTIDARKGRLSGEGVGVLRRRLRSAHEVVVFDLGVNDDPSRPAALARNLGQVRSLVGDRCLVVATLSRPPLNGVSVAEMNRVVRKFVSDTPSAHLFDWRAATESDPRLLGPDNLHPGRAGYVARARLLARAVSDCLDPDAPKPHAPDPPSAPGDEPADLSPRPSRPKAGDPIWLDWLLALRGGPLVAYIQKGIERVEEAAREMVGSLSPPRSEPTLGGPPGSPAPKNEPRRPSR